MPTESVRRPGLTTRISRSGEIAKQTGLLSFSKSAELQRFLECCGCGVVRLRAEISPEREKRCEKRCISSGSYRNRTNRLHTQGVAKDRHSQSRIRVNNVKSCANFPNIVMSDFTFHGNSHASTSFFTPTMFRHQLSVWIR